MSTCLKKYCFPSTFNIEKSFFYGIIKKKAYERTAILHMYDQLKIDFPKNMAVFCKIDYYTAVFYNTTIESVCNDFLHLNFDFSDPLLCEVYTRQKGIEDLLIYEFLSGRIEVSYRFIVKEGSSVFNSVYEKIRLDLSGKALDRLREFYGDHEVLDRVLHTFLPPDELGQRSMQVTRCDFAFDFVNYKFNIYDRCREELNNIGYDGRVRIKRGQPVKYSIRNGSERTIYLGATRSEKLIRIYDKKFEMESKKGGLGTLPDMSIDYDVNTWHRIEFQTRRGWAEYFLINAQDYLQVLQKLYSDYAFLDQQGNITNFWQELFDWELIPAIGQNAKYEVQPMTLQSLKGQYGSSVLLLCAFAAVFGKEKIFDDIQLAFANQYSPELINSYQTRKMLKRIDVLTGKKNCYSDLAGADLVAVDGNFILRLK